MCTPKDSPFAKELFILIDYYQRMFLDVINEHTLKMQRQNLIHRIDFDKFNELVGYSCLAKELVFRFITIPKAIFDHENNSFCFESLSDSSNL